MSGEQELMQALDPAQLAAAKYVPYPRRKLGLGITALLWLLRVYVLIAVPLVFYAFWRGLAAGY
ncbi:MAG: hypothetical protein PHU07_03160 [Acidocella sp.]|nr:hypothetical protein [Acidocella sp.]